MSKFQLVVLGIFALAIVAGLVLFASMKGGGSNVSYNVSIWGTLPAAEVNTYIDAAIQKDKSKISVTYTQMRTENFYKNYVESIINGNGPDALLLPHEMMWQFRTKVVPIP